MIEKVKSLPSQKILQTLLYRGNMIIMLFPQWEAASTHSETKKNGSQITKMTIKILTSLKF